MTGKNHKRNVTLRQYWFWNGLMIEKRYNLFNFWRKEASNIPSCFHRISKIEGKVTIWTILIFNRWPSFWNSSPNKSFVSRLLRRQPRYVYPFNSSAREMKRVRSRAYPPKPTSIWKNRGSKLSRNESTTTAKPFNDNFTIRQPLLAHERTRASLSLSLSLPLSLSLAGRKIHRWIACASRDF